MSIVSTDATKQPDEDTHKDSTDAVLKKRKTSDEDPQLNHKDSNDTVREKRKASDKESHSDHKAATESKKVEVKPLRSNTSEIFMSVDALERRIGSDMPLRMTDNEKDKMSAQSLLQYAKSQGLSCMVHVCSGCVLLCKDCRHCAVIFGRILGGIFIAEPMLYRLALSLTLSVPRPYGVIGKGIPLIGFLGYNTFTGDVDWKY